jgi:hypothetical protein
LAKTVDPAPIKVIFGILFLSFSNAARQGGSTFHKMYGENSRTFIKMDDSMVPVFVYMEKCALFIAGQKLHRFLERLCIQIYNSERQSYSNAFCKKERVYG